MRSPAEKLLLAVAGVGHFVIGLVQLAAIFAYFEDYLGWWWGLALLAGLVTTWFPLVGSVLGILGAMNVWEWGAPGAIALFFWPLLLYGSVLLIWGSGRSLKRVLSTKSE